MLNPFLVCSRYKANVKIFKDFWIDILNVSNYGTWVIVLRCEENITLFKVSSVFNYFITNWSIHLFEHVFSWVMTLHLTDWKVKMKYTLTKRFRILSIKWLIIFWTRRIYCNISAKYRTKKWLNYVTKYL